MIIELAIAAGFLAQAAPQPAHEERTRMLWDSTFLPKRPPARKPGAIMAAPPSVPRTNPRAEPPKQAEDGFLGVTLWLLRPSLPADERGARLLVHPKNKPPEEWTPERISTDTPLRKDQKIRISIEAARAGYLYVIDREEYRDGSLGDPHLIFPTANLRKGNNRVEPGALVEIPAWSDDPPYWELDRSRPDQVGEMLTVLVTPQPLPGVRVADSAQKLGHAQVAEWEKQWGATVQRLEAAQLLGKPYTSGEKQAAQDNGQLLSQDDPAPQTMYRVDVKPGDPLLVKVAIRIRP